MMYASLREVYLHSTQAYKELPCFSIYGGESLTFNDLAERVEALVETFQVAGLCPGDKVAIYSNNMPNWGVAYLAVAISGYIVVPILPDFSGAEVDKILEHSEAKALIASDKLYSKVSKESVAKMNLVVRTINLGVIAIKEGVERGSTAEPQSEDLASIIYTSGTTSQPKGVMLSHRNLCSELHMLGDFYKVLTSDVFLSLLPLSHTFECTLGMLLPVASGASVVYMDKPPTAAVLLPVLAAVKPTTILSVPLIIEKIYKNKILPQLTSNALMKAIYGTNLGRKVLHGLVGKRLKELFGGRVRFFGIGGAKLEASVDRFLHEAHFPYAIGYGLTETAPVLAGALPHMVRHQSTGPMLKGIEARLDQVNPLSGEGEIVVKGPNVMMGYYKNPEATADSFTADGWFRTKDLGLFDKDGYLYIKGRLTNMILGPSGENIYPEEIENVLNGHALVSDSLVQADEMGKLVAIVHFDRDELERKYNLMREELELKMEGVKRELMQYVNSKVSKFSRISLVLENEEGFVKTPTHKIKRFLYKKMTDAKK